MLFFKKKLFLPLRIFKNSLKRFNEIQQDIKIALLIFTLSMAVGIFFISNWNGTPQFYQSRFSPAVMFACGRGYVQPNVEQVPKLLDFLSIAAHPSSINTATFSCSDLPVNLQTSKPDRFAEVHRYLMETVALFWSVFGISWSALAPLYGIFYGSTVTITYGLFRLGMGRTLATIGALFLILSKIHLENLPHLRDYSKAPFILALVLITGYIVKQSPKASNLLILSAISGIVLGIGLGFRQDLLIYVPVFIPVIFLFLPSPVLIRTRIKAAIVFISCFLITGFPIFGGLLGGSNTFHVILLGFMSVFDSALNVKNSLYQWGYLYNDEFLFTLINSYSHRIYHNNLWLDFATREYERFCFLYFWEIVRNFPADMLTRIYAAILKILEFPFDTLSLNLSGVFQGKITFTAQPYLGIISILKNQVTLIIVILTALIGVHSKRLAIFILLSIIYLAGYPALQFHPRHFFHLEFISLFILGLILQQLIIGTKTIFKFNKRLKLSHQTGGIYLKRSLFFAVVTLIFLFTPLYALRWYQNNHVGNLINSYLSSPMEKLKVKALSMNNFNNQPNPKVIIKNFNLLNSKSDTFPVRSEYIVLELGGNQCTESKIPVTFRYKSLLPYRTNFSKDMNISISKTGSEETTKIFFPVYGGFYPNNEAEFNFEGIEILERDTPCVVSLRRLKDNNKHPLLLNLVLPSNWEKVARYQTIRKKVQGE